MTLCTSCCPWNGEGAEEGDPRLIAGKAIEEGGGLMADTAGSTPVLALLGALRLPIFLFSFS